jgi:ADP-ribosylglycohydrolase
MFMTSIDIRERLKGCLIAGAIGDAIGFKYECTEINQDITFDFDWTISDDTQLTLATCEAIYDSIEVKPERVAERFLYWYNHKRLIGLGSSTLKALRELQVGGHWALVGRSGEYAAGNGAAMRIAPLAFKKYITKLTIKDICTITHRNDEAYSGALAIYYSIKAAIDGIWEGDYGLMDYIIEKIPDTRVRDRLIELTPLQKLSIAEIGKIYKSTGYVVDSVSLAVFTVQKINELDYATIITELIKLGGDTDTVCSMFGQIAGSLYGTKIIPDDLMYRFEKLEITDLISEIVNNWKE